MSKYNQLQLSDNLHAEVTDQTVYLMHEDSQWATALDHEQFEELFAFYKDILNEFNRGNRARVTVYDGEDEPVEYTYTSLDTVGEVVEEFQRGFGNDHRVEVDVYE